MSSNTEKENKLNFIALVSEKEQLEPGALKELAVNKKAFTFEERKVLELIECGKIAELFNNEASELSLINLMKRAEGLTSSGIQDNNLIFNLYKKIILASEALNFEEKAAELQKKAGKKRLEIKHRSALAEINEPAYLVNAFIEAGSVNVLAGEAGTGKTYLALELIRAVSTGAAFLSMNARQANCLFVDNESNESILKMRVEALERASGEVMNFEYINEQIKFDNDTTKELKAYIENNNIKLIVIDSLMASNIGANENDVKDTMLYFQKMKELARSGASIFIIHHLNKTGGVRGSSAIKGAVDNLFTLTAENAAKDIKKLKLASEKNRSGFFEPLWYNMQFSSAGTHFYNCEKPAAGEAILKDIIRYVSENENVIIKDILDNFNSEFSYPQKVTEFLNIFNEYFFTTKKGRTVNIFVTEKAKAVLNSNN